MFVDVCVCACVCVYVSRCAYMRLNAIIVDVQACVLSYSVLRLCSVCARVSMLRLSLLNSW